MSTSAEATLAIELEVSIVDLPSARIAETWTEDDGVLGVIDALCGMLHEEEAATFRVAFAGESWPVDVYTDLATFLIELPNLAGGIRTGTYCEIHLYEQGMQRLLCFTPAMDGWSVRANTSSATWDPPAETAHVGAGELVRNERRCARRTNRALVLDFRGLVCNAH